MYHSAMVSLLGAATVSFSTVLYLHDCSPSGWFYVKSYSHKATAGLAIASKQLNSENNVAGNYAVFIG